MRFSLALALLPALASAIHAPSYDGFELKWQDSFEGQAGDRPNEGEWNIMTELSVNNELQQYTTESKNLQLSGGQSLQIIPCNDNGQWTSGRIESRRWWVTKPGRKMRVEAKLNFGYSDNSRKAGIWPAFWMLGQSIREGTDWPLCGEIDIMERVNGLATGYGTVHCGASREGGPCGEPNGLGKDVPLPDNDFHRWTMIIDRTSGSWLTETITWYFDDQLFHSLDGQTVNDEGAWSTLAHSPMYMLLNVAVGGNWPGPPDGNTEGGFNNMMEVQYVAVYEQK